MLDRYSTVIAARTRIAPDGASHQCLQLEISRYADRQTQTKAAANPIQPNSNHNMLLSCLLPSFVGVEKAFMSSD